MDEAPEVMAAGKYLRLVKRGHWEFADRHTCKGAVAIVAVTDERRLLLVEQFRIPLMKNVLELPAGLVGDVAGEEHRVAPDTRRPVGQRERGRNDQHEKIDCDHPPLNRADRGPVLEQPLADAEPDCAILGARRCGAQ